MAPTQGVGSCASGWQTCGAEVGGGCCPPGGYECGTESCTKGAGAKVTGTGGVSVGKGDGAEGTSAGVGRRGMMELNFGVIVVGIVVMVLV